MQGSLRIPIIATATVAASLAFASAALAQDETTPPLTPPVEDPEPQPQADAELSLDLKGLKGKNVRVNKRVVAFATVKPFVPGQELQIGVYRKGKAVKQERKTIERKNGTTAGIVKLKSSRFVEPGKFSVRAVHAETDEQKAAGKTSKRFGVKYPKLGGNDNGEVVQLFHNLLDKQGYGNAPNGKDYTDATARAVHAFRKANGLPRTFSSSPEIFRKVADGKGSFKLRYPDAGHHVEVDISKQVMVLADNGKPQLTYHISSGTPATPSDRGHYTFYRKDPGFNSIGMYYSVYYNRGEATHGYKSVPDYPASHGCLRNPIPDSRTIYNWIDLGDSIWVYD
ncbi:MAG: L,D-transpeptidase family protein [Solirubrobacterales bacterium]